MASAQAARGSGGSAHLVYWVSQPAQLIHSSPGLHVWVVPRPDGPHAGWLVPACHSPHEADTLSDSAQRHPPRHSWSDCLFVLTRGPTLLHPMWNTWQQANLEMQVFLTRTRH